MTRPAPSPDWPRCSATSMPIATSSVEAHSASHWLRTADPLAVDARRKDPRCYVGDVVEATETDDGLAIKGRFDLDTEFGKSAYRNTKGRRVSGLSIGYAIRNSTKTAAGNELTDLRHDSPQLCAFTPSPSIPCR